MLLSCGKLSEMHRDWHLSAFATENSKRTQTHLYAYIRIRKEDKNETHRTNECFAAEFICAETVNMIASCVCDTNEVDSKGAWASVFV